MEESRAHVGVVEVSSLAVDPQWTLARRVASSKTFSSSARLPSFLLYVCKCAVSGCLAEINEQQIGVHVFGRAPGYNSNEDSVVRSQARLLRTRLGAYFQNEGRYESLVIRIPKGSYVPKFEPRTPSVTPPPEEPCLPVAARVGLASEWQVRWAVGAILALVLVAISIGLRYQSPRTPASLFWAQMFDRSHPTMVVPDDAALVLIQIFTHKQVDLKTYLSRTYLGNTGDFHTGVGGHRYTGLTDVVFFSHLSRLPSFDPDRTVIRYARDLQTAELRGANLILVGARCANPWVELFDQKNNFQGLFSENSSDFIVNRAPKPGERAFYARESRPDGDRTYGLVSFVPGITGVESVLMVGGTDTPGTEGACNFLFSPEFDDFLAKTAAARVKTRFEILLRMGTFNGSAQRTEIVTYRLHPD